HLGSSHHDIVGLLRQAGDLRALGRQAFGFAGLLVGHALAGLGMRLQAGGIDGDADAGLAHDDEALAQRPEEAPDRQGQGAEGPGPVIQGCLATAQLPQQTSQTHVSSAHIGHAASFVKKGPTPATTRTPPDHNSPARFGSYWVSDLTRDLHLTLLSQSPGKTPGRMPSKSGKPGESAGSASKSQACQQV